MKSEPKVKFYEDKRKEWRWRVNRGSEITGASSEGFTTRKEAEEDYEFSLRPAKGYTAHVKAEGRIVPQEEVDRKRDSRTPPSEVGSNPGTSSDPAWPQQ